MTRASRTSALLQDKGCAYSHLWPIASLKWKHAALGVDTIDLTDDFMRAGMANLTLTTGDIFHPNQTGNAIMAKSLATYVNQHLKPRLGP